MDRGSPFGLDQKGGKSRPDHGLGRTAHDDSERKVAKPDRGESGNHVELGERDREQPRSRNRPHAAALQAATEAAELLGDAPTQALAPKVPREQELRAP